MARPKVSHREKGGEIRLRDDDDSFVIDENEEDGCSSEDSNITDVPASSDSSDVEKEDKGGLGNRVLPAVGGPHASPFDHLVLMPQMYANILRISPGHPYRHRYQSVTLKRVKWRYHVLQARGWLQKYLGESVGWWHDDKVRRIIRNSIDKSHEIPEACFTAFFPKMMTWLEEQVRLFFCKLLRHHPPLRHHPCAITPVPLPPLRQLVADTTIFLHFPTVAHQRKNIYGGRRTTNSCSPSGGYYA